MPRYKKYFLPLKSKCTVRYKSFDDDLEMILNFQIGYPSPSLPLFRCEATFVALSVRPYVRICVMTYRLVHIPCPIGPFYILQQIGQWLYNIPVYRLLGALVLLVLTWINSIRPCNWRWRRWNFLMIKRLKVLFGNDEKLRLAACWPTYDCACRFYLMRIIPIINFLLHTPLRLLFFGELVLSFPEKVYFVDVIQTFC